LFVHAGLTVWYSVIVIVHPEHQSCKTVICWVSSLGMLGEGDRGKDGMCKMVMGECGKTSSDLRINFLVEGSLSEVADYKTETVTAACILSGGSRQTRHPFNSTRDNVRCPSTRTIHKELCSKCRDKGQS
jgi:hypothetical protein